MRLFRRASGKFFMLSTTVFEIAVDCQLELLGPHVIRDNVVDIRGISKLSGLERS